MHSSRVSNVLLCTSLSLCHVPSLCRVPLTLTNMKCIFILYKTGTTSYNDVWMWTYISCSPGEYSNGTSCIACELGYFSSNGISCSPCPIGSFTNMTRSTMCTPCQGRYSTITIASTSSTSCSPCPAGKAIGNATSGASICLSCSPGKYSVNNGSAECTSCERGLF